MSLLPRKGPLAIAAVVDVALQGGGRPISAKTLTAGLGLPPRYLESLLQSLVRNGILKGIRGPRGGYQLARDLRGVTANDILRAAGTIDAVEERPGSRLLAEVVIPVLSSAEQQLSQALNGIKLEDIMRQAEGLSGAVPSALGSRPRTLLDA